MTTTSGGTKGQLQRRNENLAHIIESLDQRSLEEHGGCVTGPMGPAYFLIRGTCVNPLLRCVRGLRAPTTTELFSGALRSLIDQVVRSATSVTANLMEGSGKLTAESMHVFIRIARGSLWETIDHLESLEQLCPEMFDPVEFMKLTAAWVSASHVFDACYGDFLESTALTYNKQL